MQSNLIIIFGLLSLAILTVLTFCNQIRGHWIKHWMAHHNSKLYVGAFNVEKAYFNQRLECAAPKRWSKCTTAIILWQAQFHMMVLLVSYFGNCAEWMIHHPQGSIFLIGSKLEKNIFFRIKNIYRVYVEVDWI